MKSMDRDKPRVVFIGLVPPDEATNGVYST